MIFSRSRSVLASTSAGWYLLAQGDDLFAQSLGLGFDLGRLGAIGGLQRCQVTLDALFDLLLALVDFARREVAVATVDRLELAAVDGHHRPGKQLQVPAQLHEAAADVADAFAIVMAEVGNGLEVGRQSTGQPHQLDIALRLALQPTAGRDAVQVAVDVELEQHRRVVRRPPGRRRIGAGKTQLLQIQLVDKGVDRAHRIIFGDVVVQILR